MGSEKYSLTCRCDAPATMHSFALFLSLFLSLLEPLTRNEISYVCMSLCMRVRMRLRVCACVRVGSLSGNQLLLHPGAELSRVADCKLIRAARHAALFRRVVHAHEAHVRTVALVEPVDLGLALATTVGHTAAFPALRKLVCVIL